MMWMNEWKEFILAAKETQPESRAITEWYYT